MAAKPLPSQEFLRECFLYDPETGVLTWRERPLHHFRNIGVMRRVNSRRMGTIAGSPAVSHSRSAERLIINMNGKIWKAHRLIWRLQTGDDAETIDHKNCDPLDNRWSNLRHATVGQNTQNRRGNRGRTLPKGVTYRYGRWYVRIALGGKSTHIGVFDTVDHAKYIYGICVQALHGEFANVGDH